MNKYLIYTNDAIDTKIQNKAYRVAEDNETLDQEDYGDLFGEFEGLVIINDSIEAESEDEAIEKARAELDAMDFDNQINLTAVKIF